MHLKFLVDVLQVKIDRSGLDTEFGRCGLVVVAFDQELEDSYFVRSQIIFGAFWRPNFAKQLDHPAGDFGRHWCSAFHGFFHAGNQPRRLQSRETLPHTFSNLDLNGDGRVTFTEILNYGGVGWHELHPFLAFVAQEMQLGAGGEDVNALPGVTLEMVSSRGNNTWSPIGNFDANINGLANDPTAVEYLPGFADGSVRLTRLGDFRFSESSFFSTLNQLDPANATAWAGEWCINDQSGNAVTGILIGLLQPPSPNKPTSRNAPPCIPICAPPTLDGLLISTNGGGVWRNVIGAGPVTINWGDQTLNGPFHASFTLAPWAGAGQPSNDPNDVNH